MRSKSDLFRYNYSLHEGSDAELGLLCTAHLIDSKALLEKLHHLNTLTC